jgi:hypothetical protein
MPGKLYLNDIRLSRAFAEGSMGAPEANPHPEGSPAAEAYAAGAAATKSELTTSPNSDWLKADIQAWLTDAGIEYPSDATKAELLELAGVN